MTGILASWELGLRYGHVAMLDALAAALANGGHRVSLAAKDLLAVTALPRSHFANVLQAPVYLRGRSRSVPTVTYGQVIAEAGFLDPRAIDALVRGWLALFDLVKPDLLIAEHAPVSLLAAYICGLPAARIGTPFSAPAASTPMPRLISRELVAGESDVDPDHAIDSAINAAVTRFGRPAIDGIAGLLGQAPEFLATWPELDFSDVRSGRAYYGPLASLSGVARPDWPYGDGPKIFVYLPFEHPAASAVCDILVARGWPTIWHTQSFPSLPLSASIRYTSEPVDIDVMLPQTEVIIGRAGHGLSAAALRYGVPGLVFPDTLEAGLVAACLVRAAFAVMPRQASLVAIEAGLDQLTQDTRIMRACAQARCRYSGYDAEAAASRMAADILETVGAANRR